MPNQHSEDEVFLEGYVDGKLYRRLLSFAVREGMKDDVSGLIQKLVEVGLARRKKAYERRGGANRPVSGRRK